MHSNMYQNWNIGIGFRIGCLGIVHFVLKEMRDLLAPREIYKLNLVFLPDAFV